MDKEKRDQVKCKYCVLPGLFCCSNNKKGEAKLNECYALFLKKHNCLECAYKMESHNCFKEGMCLLDIYSQDICNGCPYKRNTGKCVGFCMKKLLKK